MTPGDDPDHKRLEGWVREHSAPIRAFLRARLGAGGPVDDLLQDTFVRAWNARAEYREQGHPKAWLIRIADRLAIDWLRRQRRWKPLDDEAQAELPDRSAEPEFEPGVDGDRLRGFLGSLSERQRQAILLRFFTGLPFAEVAREMGCPLATALSHVHRGLAALRERMKGAAT
jgi:RNA polymerase sigma-70 factor (ECF subfamily)